MPDLPHLRLGTILVAIGDGLVIPKMKEFGLRFPGSLDSTWLQLEGLNTVCFICYQSLSRRYLVQESPIPQLLDHVDHECRLHGELTGLGTRQGIQCHGSCSHGLHWRPHLHCPSLESWAVRNLQPYNNFMLQLFLIHPGSHHQSIFCIHIYIYIWSDL